jgi:ABC-type branched-subunit amino acid transport system substrate-binding protein
MGVDREAQSKKKKAGWGWLALLVLALAAGCGTAKPGSISRIALLAPFEGRYREVGYNAYYAVKLALSDYGRNDIEFVAVDDGGSVQSAVRRARALTNDPLLKAVIVMGYNATDQATQVAFKNIPVLIVGDWVTKPESQNTFLLTNPQIASLMSIPQDERDVTDMANLDGAVLGNEVLALEQYPLLAPASRQITAISSGSLPDANFIQRYGNSAEFTPPPGLLATLTYDATHLLLQAIMSAENSDLTTVLENIYYTGLNGNIQFEDGYWIDAPIHYFGYDNSGQLISVESPIE